MRNIFGKNLLNLNLILQLSFYTETSFFDVLSSVITCFTFCHAHGKVTNLLTSVLLELN